jgi:WD40 repeat protein
MVYDMCVTLNNKYLYAGGGSNIIIVFNLESKQLEKTLLGHKGKVPWVSLSIDGKYVLTTSYTETCVWRASTFENIITI